MPKTKNDVHYYVLVTCGHKLENGSRVVEVVLCVTDMTGGHGWNDYYPLYCLDGKRKPMEMEPVTAFAVADDLNGRAVSCLGENGNMTAVVIASPDELENHPGESSFPYSVYAEIKNYSVLNTLGKP